MPEISMAARMLSAPHDMGRMQLHDQEKSVRRSVDILAYLLATAPPSEQKTVCMSIPDFLLIFLRVSVEIKKFKNSVLQVVITSLNLGANIFFDYSVLAGWLL